MIFFDVQRMNATVEDRRIPGGLVGRNSEAHSAEFRIAAANWKHSPLPGTMSPRSEFHRNPVTLVTPTVRGPVLACLMNTSASWTCDSMSKEDIMVPKIRAFWTALCVAWAQHLLARAIADLAARSEWDCSVVGLDRAVVLAGLTQLHGVNGASALPTANRLDPGPRRRKEMSR
jgi:hypothetical protein